MKDHLLEGYLEGALAYVLQHHPGKDAPDAEDTSSVDSDDDDSDNISIRDFAPKGGEHSGGEASATNGGMPRIDVVSARSSLHGDLTYGEPSNGAAHADPIPTPVVARRVRGPGGLHRGLRGPKKKVSWEEAEEIARSVHGPEGIPGVVPSLKEVERDVEMGLLDPDQRQKPPDREPERGNGVGTGGGLVGRRAASSLGFGSNGARGEDPDVEMGLK